MDARLSVQFTNLFGRILMSSIVSTSRLDKKRVLRGLCIFVLLLLITVGVFAANDWFPKTDPMSGKMTGWFGRELPKNATSAWNPIPPPSPTPQLSKEYIYAGQRLLAVEDANATSAPPADIAVWRPSNGNWMVMGQTGSQAVTENNGLSGDIPVPGDYEGDGKTDFAIWRPSNGYWWVLYSSGSGITVPLGTNGDTPIPTDFDGDGRTDIATARWDSGLNAMVWTIATSSGTPAYLYYQWGLQTDILCPADYDGDGKADLASYRPSDGNLYIYFPATNSFGGAALASGADKCVSSDYDGDGKADPAVYNSANANWTISRSTDGNTSTTTWGSTGNIPVHNDYDGDGKTDLAVWNNATSAQWLIKRSSNGTTRTEIFGTTGDIPVPAFYRR